MKTTKRWLALLMVMTLLLSYLSPAAAAAELTDTADPAANESVTLRVWAAETDQTWLSQQADAFAAAHPEWDITWDFGVCSPGDAYTMITGNPEETPDVYMFTSDVTTQLFEADALAALTGDVLGQVSAEHSDMLLNTLTCADGQVHGIPMSGNTWFMYYNKSIFSEEDVTSLEAMLEKGVVAFEVANSWYLPAFYFANGCTMFGEYGNDAAAGIDFGGEKAVAVTEYLVGLLNNPNFICDHDGAGNAGLKDGTIGAYFSGSWDYPGLYAELGENLGAAQLPTITISGEQKQLRAFAGSIALGVNPNSDHSEAAMAFAAFLGTAESQKARYEASGAIPSCASLAEDPAIASNAAAAAQINTLNHTAVVQPSIPEMVNYWISAGNFANALCNGEITLENAAAMTKQLNSDINGITTISLWTFPTGNLTSEEGISTMIADFQEAHPGIELEVKVLSYETGYAELEEAIANGNAPDLLLESPETLVLNYGAGGLLADLSDMIDDEDISEFYPGALAAGYDANGSLYMYPMYGTVHTMAINKTVFEAAGALQYLDETSRTWNSTEDFFKAIQAVYEYTGKPVAGLPCESIGGDQGPRGIVTNLYGGTFTNAEHTAYTWDSEEMVAALQALYDCPGIEFRTDLNGAEEIGALVDGTVNMAVVWNVAQHLNCNGVTANGDEIMILAFPSDVEPKLQSGLWGFGVFDNGNSARIDAAKSFIKFMADSAYTADAVVATTFFPLRTNAEGNDLSGIWAHDEVRNDFNAMMHMIGDYYQVCVNWRDARFNWVSLLQAVAAGEDIASAAAYWNAETNGEGKTQISVLAPAYSGYTPGWWEQFEADYEAAYPDVDLVIECTDWNNIYTRLNEGDIPDILNIDVYEEFVDRLLPVQEYMSQETYSKIYDCFLAESEMNGTVWAVPDLASARGLYCNMDMLEAVGMDVPTTWAELEAVCAAIKEYYGDDVIPFGLDMSENEGQLAFALAAWNNGGSFVDENGNWAVNSDANVEAVEFLMHMLNSGYTNNMAMTRYELMDQFIQGQVVMTVAPSGWNPGNSFEIAPIPANEGCTSWSMGVMDRIMCFNNGYSEEELAAITAFFDFFYDDERYADWVFEEGFLPATSTGMAQFAQDNSFLASWADILPNCRFYPANKSGWGTARQGVIGVLGEASNGGDVRQLLDDLQAQLTGGGEEDDHSPFLSFRWLDNYGDGWFQGDSWKYDGNDWCNGYMGFGAIPGDEFWHVYYLNIWNEETQSYDATPVHVEFSEQFDAVLLYDTEESIMPGAEAPEYFYHLRVLEGTWDQTGIIRYTMDDGTELTLNVHLSRGEAGFYSSTALRNDTYIRDFYIDRINPEENVFYFGFQSDYWTLESVEPVLGHLGIPDHSASDVFTVEKVNNNVYKITLTPWAVSLSGGIEVGLNLYLTDPEGNSNNGDWYQSIWCHVDWENEIAVACIGVNNWDYNFFPTSDGEIAAYTNMFSGEYDNDGNGVWCFEQVPLPEGFSYDPDTNTVTLNNVSMEHLRLGYEGFDENTGASWYDLPNANVTIELIGENTFVCGWSSALAFCNGVNATITGDGSLKLYSENYEQTDDNGNYVNYNTLNMWNGANLTIAGNASVTVEIDGQGLESCWDGDTYLGSRPAHTAAIEGGMGTLTLKDNASLTTIVPEGSKTNGPKLENEDQVFWDDWYPGGYRGIGGMAEINIEGGTLNTQEIELGDYWDENGFQWSGSFIQSGGTVNITARGSYGESEIWQWDEEAQEDVYMGTVDHYHYNGLYNHNRGYIEISGGELNIQCLQTEEELASSAWADAVHLAEGEFMMSGGTVNVQTNRGYAFSVNSLTVTGGTVNTNDAIGSQNLVISGGTVTVEDHPGTVIESLNITINGGKVIGSSHDGTAVFAQNIKVTDGLLDITGENGYTVDVSNSFEVSGGTVNLNGKYGDVLNLNDADMTITGGTVTVSGENGLLIGVGGWDDPANFDGGMDGTLTMTGGKLISNYTGDLGTALETRPYGKTTITGGAQVEMNGHLVTYGTLDILENASVSITNGGFRVEDGGIMTLEGGELTVDSAWNSESGADDYALNRIGCGGKLIIHGGSITVDAVNYCKALLNEGTYIQNGGEVSITLSGDRIGYPYNEESESYEYYPGFALSSSGITTINGGVLNLNAQIGIEHYFETGDPENPENPDWHENRNTKLTVNGGTINIEAEWAGFDINGPAEFNGGTINIENRGMYIPWYDIWESYGLVVRSNGYAEADVASSITINGGDFHITCPNEGDNYSTAGIRANYAPVYVNGGNLQLQARFAVRSFGETQMIFVADHMNIVSLTSADTKDLLPRDVTHTYTDEEGNEVAESFAFTSVEEDNLPGDVVTGEGLDECTGLLITSGICGENSAWDLDNGALVISGTGVMTDYTSGDETPWALLRDKITSVTVEAGVTGIGSCAFAGCTAVATITFLGNAPVIADNAFQNVNATAYYYADTEGWEDNLNSYGGSISWEAIEEDPFRFTTQPTDFVGLVGDIATFTVATNADSVSYRWFYSTDGGETWLRLSNTTDTYSLEFLAYRLNYQYRCEVTNNDTGEVLISEAASLLAEDIPLEIITQPVSYVGAVNDNVTFLVEAVGNGLVYEWFFSNDGGVTWAKSYSPGYQTDMLAPILRTHRDGNMYKCVITDVFGDSVTTEIVSMSVKASDVIITTQPEDVENGVLGQLYLFTVEANGDNLTYRWQFSDDGGVTWQESWNQGYNSATLNVRLNANRDGNQYRCVVTSGLKTVVISRPAVLSLQAPSAEIISQSGNVAIIANKTATFTVDAEGTDLTYLWYRSNDKGATWNQTYLSGYNTDTLSFVGTVARAAMYMCKVTDGSGKVVWSEPVKLQILSAELKILTQPESITCASGATATFTVEAQGDGLKYQWYASADGGETWTISYLGGYNTATFSFAVNATRAAKLYKCVITDAGGNTVETNAVSVTIG